MNAAGDGEVGRRPQVAAHAGTDTCAGEFPTNGVGCAAFESLGENGYGECGRIGDQQVDMVGFAVELDQLDVEVRAHTAHGALGVGEYGAGEQFAPVFGYEDQMCVEQRHAVPVAAVGRGCQ